MIEDLSVLDVRGLHQMAKHVSAVNHCPILCYVPDLLLKTFGLTDNLLPIQDRTCPFCHHVLTPTEFIPHFQSLACHPLAQQELTVFVSHRGKIRVLRG